MFSQDIFFGSGQSMCCQCFFFHRVDGGLIFPVNSTFITGEWASGASKTYRGRSPRENFRVFLIILIRKVIKKYMIHSPLITGHYCSETGQIYQRPGVGPQESLPVRCKSARLPLDTSPSNYMFRNFQGVYLETFFQKI